MADKKSMDWGYLKQNLLTGALFEGIELTGVVDGGHFSLARGGISVASDFVSCYLSDWLGAMIDDVKTRERVKAYLLGPLASGIVYVIVSHCILKVDNRKWMGPLLEQIIASEGSTFIMHTDWGKSMVPVNPAV